MVGSVAMLLAFLAHLILHGNIRLHANSPDWRRTGQIAALAREQSRDWHGLTAEQLALVHFLRAAFLGFAVKVPLMPFHTWLPADLCGSPTGTTMLLTGAMSKMGVYGFLRILLPIFPSRCDRC